MCLFVIVDSLFIHFYFGASTFFLKKEQCTFYLLLHNEETGKK